MGGWLIGHASWLWVFFINVPLGAAVIAISLWHVPESRSSTPQKADWMGASVATVGMAGMVFGFCESATLGWRHSLVLGSLAVGVCRINLFLYFEKSETITIVSLFR